MHNPSPGVAEKYTQQRKKRKILFLLNWLKIKYVDFKKYVLHVTYISWIQHILFSVNLKVTSFRFLLLLGI